MRLASVEMGRAMERLKRRARPMATTVPAANVAKRIQRNRSRLWRTGAALMVPAKERPVPATGAMAKSEEPVAMTRLE